MDKKWEKVINDYEKHAQHVAKATLVKLGEKPVDKANRMKTLQKRYEDWFEYYFPHYAKVKCAEFHKKLAKKIIKNKRIKLLAEIYRSGGKSVHLDMGIPLYLYVTGGLKFMLLIGETDPKAKRLLGDIQAELTYNQRFINDYGIKFKQGNWADGNFYTNDGVRFMSLGFGMSPRGLREGAQRPDYISIDDVDTKRHVNNDEYMGNAVDYILEEVMGCFDSEDNGTERLVFANNNFHKKSITNRLKLNFLLNIKQDKAEGLESDYDVLSVPAVKDLVSFTPNWPEKTTSEYWRNKYRKNRRGFLREYMHIHVADGKMFKAEMMQWKKMLPLHEYEYLVLYGDLSYKEQGDYKALGLQGKHKREYHIIFSFLRQCSRRDAARWLYDLYEDWNLADHNIIYKFEGLFAQDEFINDFDEEGDERGYYIPIIADKRPKEGKFDRVESMLGFWERRQYWWNEDEKDTLDQNEAVEQFTSFEKGSKAHDDFPDMIHGGLREMQEASMPSRSEPLITPRGGSSKSRHRS